MNFFFSYSTGWFIAEARYAAQVFGKSAAIGLIRGEAGTCKVKPPQKRFSSAVLERL